MEVEKQSSKGGFFQLFDWNAKSRKKLFSKQSELPAGSKQGKENSDGASILRLQQMKAHENGPGPSVRESDYNCASSASNDEGCGTKAPGVVARLMGLDSLPTSNVSEPGFTPFFDSHSFRDSHPPRSTSGFHNECHIIDYDNIRNKLDGFSRNPVELRLQKVHNRPIERFQTEILPPKSAKSISTTHHRLLSPIKSPGFILTKNAAYIMEAAAKIIEQSPQSTTKGKLPSFGSSVPLRIRDLKEKMEEAQKASRLHEASLKLKEHSSVKYMKGQPSDRSRSESEDSQLFKDSMVPKQGGSGSLKNKEKCVSLAIQAKVNVQRREGSAASGNRSSTNPKEDNEVKSGHLDKKQRNMQKSVRKRTSIGSTSNVLRQNNQKQNCSSNKDGVSSTHIAADQQVRKSLFTNGSCSVNKTVNKVVGNSAIGARKMKSVAVNTGKELSSSKTKNFSGKKRPVVGDHFNVCVIDDVLIDKNERSVKCNVSIDGCTNWDAVDRKSGMDVVSFTFTSPIKKSVPGSPSYGQSMEMNNSFCLNRYDDQPDSNTSTSSSLGLNVVGGDALSMLLEQKLKELTCRVESSHCNLVEDGHALDSVSTLQNLPSLNVVNTFSTGHDRRLQFGLHKDIPGSQHDSDCSSVDGLLLKAKQKWQAENENDMDNLSGSVSRVGFCLRQIPVTSLEDLKELRHLG